MAHALTMGALMSAPSLSLNASYSPPSSAEPYTLTVVEHADEPAPYQAPRQLTVSNTVFGIGLTGAIAGTVVTGVGVVIAVIGIVPAIFFQPGVFITGLIVAATGVGIVSVSTPIAVTGALMGAAQLRKAGIEVSIVPGLVAIGGLGLAVAGLAAEGDVEDALLTAGLATTAVGCGVQVFLSNKAFQQYKQQYQIGLWMPTLNDGYGAGLALRF